MTILQVSDYAEERRLAATMPVLTPIGDGVSSAVREQYEENPYPRWLRPGPLGETAVSTYSGPPLTGDAADCRLRHRPIRHRIRAVHPGNPESSPSI